MQWLVQVVLLAGAEPGLAERLEATWADDPAAAEQAVALLLDDPRVVASPSFLVPPGQAAEMIVGREIPVVDEVVQTAEGPTPKLSFQELRSLDLHLTATPADEGRVHVALDIARDLREPVPDPEFDGAWRLPDGGPQLAEVRLSALEGRFVADELGDLTVLVRPVSDPEPGAFASIAGRDPELRPRARRRAIDALLVD